LGSRERGGEKKKKKKEGKQKILKSFREPVVAWKRTFSFWSVFFVDSPQLAAHGRRPEGKREGEKKGNVLTSDCL